MLSLKEMEINSLLKDFSWLKDKEYVEFENLLDDYEFGWKQF